MNSTVFRIVAAVLIVIGLVGGLVVVSLIFFPMAACHFYGCIGLLSLISMSLRKIVSDRHCEMQSNGCPGGAGGNIHRLH